MKRQPSLRPHSLTWAANQNPLDRVRVAQRSATSAHAPVPTLMALRPGTRSLYRALRQSPRHRNYSIQQLPGDYSVVLPREPFVWGVSHIIPRPVPIHIPRPPYIKGDRPILDDTKHGEPFDGDGRIALGSSEEKSLRKAALLARDALNYASTLVKVVASSIDPACA